jgi:hypothetical protein
MYLIENKRETFVFLDKKSDKLKRIEDLKIEEFSNFLDVKEHTYNNVEYIRYEYDFKSVDLYRLISFVTCIKDSIDVICNHIYDSDGNEICIPRPGDIVSIVDDRKNDYIVSSISFFRKNCITYENKEFGFNFNLLKIAKFNKDTIIYDGETINVGLNKIVNSRNNIIGNILNN